MEKVIHCRDLGYACDGIIRAHNEKEAIQLAILHAERMHNLNEVTPEVLAEIREAIQEVEQAPDIIRKEEQKVGTFSSRADESLPERRIVPFTGHYGRREDFTGDNIFFRGRPGGQQKAYHADKNCPRLPSGSLTAYPESYVKGLRWVRTCSYCTRELNDE